MAVAVGSDEQNPLVGIELSCPATIQRRDRAKPVAVLATLPSWHGLSSKVLDGCFGRTKSIGGLKRLRAALCECVGMAVSTSSSIAFTSSPPQALMLYWIIPGAAEGPAAARM